MFLLFLHVVILAFNLNFGIVLTFGGPCAYNTKSEMMEIFVYALAILNLVTLGWLLFLTLKYRYIVSKAEILFSDKAPANLAATLKKYLEDVKVVEDHCFALDKTQKKIHKVAAEGLSKAGFVRYNPFGDVGGNQSFSLCLLNSANTGFVISSIHSREGTRVYAKTVVNGHSEYNLSDEELKAIQIAKKE
jgi:hypothetical protein